MEQLQRRYNDYLSAKVSNQCTTNNRQCKETPKCFPKRILVFSLIDCQKISTPFVSILKQYLILKILE